MAESNFGKINFAKKKNALINKRQVVLFYFNDCSLVYTNYPQRKQSPVQPQQRITVASLVKITALIISGLYCDN